MINNIVFSGRLTRDPETRVTTTGMQVVSFTLAYDEVRGGQKTTIFMPITVFGKQGEVASKFLRKGNMAGVVGRLTQRKYVRKTDNVEVTSTEIVADRIDLMEPKKASTNDTGYEADVPVTPAAPAQRVTPNVAPEPMSNGTDPLLEDDYPF